MISKSSIPFIFFIIAAAIAVLGLQVLFTIENFHVNKMDLVEEISKSFDKAIETYYYKDALEEFITIQDEIPNRSFKLFSESIVFDSISKKPIDSIKIVKDQLTKIIPITSYKIIKGKEKADSISSMRNKGNTLFLPWKKDSLKLKDLNARFDHELKKRAINLEYLTDFKNKNISYSIPHKASLTSNWDSILAESILLPEGSSLKVYYKIPTSYIIKISAYELVLSTILSLFIILSIIYLMRTNQIQKKEMQARNDFISNISHEFKTPIATVSSALEAVKKFSGYDIDERQNKYLDIANQNLKKLNGLTEKILEASSLENENVFLQIKTVEIISFLKSIILNFEASHPEKQFFLLTSLEKLSTDIDVFYFETAINNLLDNAAKYGGSKITIRLSTNSKAMKIEIEDNGAGIDKSEGSKIFEKFYRIPKGNLHNVRGYGLGLYHAKKIIESHAGILQLEQHYPTKFSIELPHE